MGMLWREELEGHAPDHPKRLNVVHLIREELEGDELDDELERDLSDAGDGESCPHLIPAGRRSAGHAAR